MDIEFRLFCKILSRYVIILIIFIATSMSTKSQINIDSELKFVHHLISLKQYKDAIYLLEKSQQLYLPKLWEDSINYLIGNLKYKQKQLESSSQYLLAVSPQSSQFFAAQFFASYNLIYLGKYDQSTQILNSLTSTDSLYTELKTFQLSGIALLQRDFDKFEFLSQNFSYGFYAFEKEAQNLIDYKTALCNYKPKSVFLASSLSILMPGLGKIYTGKIGEGIYSFMINVALASAMLENYNKAGFKNPKTIIFASLFSIFYIGNIYGSFYSAKRVNYEFQSQNDKHILLDLHLPLRTIFR